MDILEQAQDVVAAIPQTPREFLVSKLGEAWKTAVIARYRPQAESTICCYLAVLDTVCPDCSEHSTNITMFADAPDGYRMLHPEQTEVAL